MPESWVKVGRNNQSAHQTAENAVWQPCIVNTIACSPLAICGTIALAQSPDPGKLMHAFGQLLLRTGLFLPLAFGLSKLTACAAPVERLPTRLQARAETGLHADAVLLADAKFTLNTGYQRTIRADSRWHYFGQLPMGMVYQPLGSTFSIEGEHVHEAYLVVDSGRLVGFYLPVERSFAPLTQVVHLRFQAR